MQQRLFEITYLLTQHGALTAGQLAERFGVSRRTIYRDIDALSAAGIPVYAEKGKGGGIRMMPEFVLNKTLFSKDEQAQLVAHFQSLDSIGTPDTAPVLEKLSALFGRRESWLEVDFAPWAGGDEARSLFRTLRDAILRRQTIAFLYMGTGGGQTARTVEPLRVIFRGQGWYLYGFCRNKNDFRLFKMSRMRDVSLPGEAFEPRPVPEAADAPYEGPLLHFLLHIDARLAFRVYDEFRAEDITLCEDGSFLVRCVFPPGEWVTGYLLGFGPGAEVLEPADRREEFQSLLQSMLARYESEPS